MSIKLNDLDRTKDANGGEDGIFKERMPETGSDINGGKPFRCELYAAVDHKREFLGGRVHDAYFVLLPDFFMNYEGGKTAWLKADFDTALEAHRKNFWLQDRLLVGGGWYKKMVRATTLQHPLTHHRHLPAPCNPCPPEAVPTCRADPKEWGKSGSGGHHRGSWGRRRRRYGGCMPPSPTPNRDHPNLT